jgi:hypothetical protein
VLFRFRGFLGKSHSPDRKASITILRFSAEARFVADARSYSQTTLFFGGLIMTNKTVLGCLAFGFLSALGSPCLAFGVSHHGGVILDCTPPLFFDESPAKDAKVAGFREFSFVASDNTDRDTIKVWANNQPVAVEIAELRSGRLAVQGRLPEPVAAGRVWLKVTGYSHDGCDQLHTWNVYVGE